MSVSHIISEKFQEKINAEIATEGHAAVHAYVNTPKDAQRCVEQREVDAFIAGARWGLERAGHIVVTVIAEVQTQFSLDDPGPCKCGPNEKCERCR